MKSIQKLIAVALVVSVVLGLTSCHRGSGCPTDLKVDTSKTESTIA